MIKQRKYLRNYLAGLLVLILLITAVTGCGSVDSPTGSGVKEEELSATPAEGDVGTSKTSEAQPPEQNRFELYCSLLFQMLDEINLILGEEPEKTAEEAFDYKKAGILVWFERGEASQIWIADGTVDFNGARVGDGIEKFKEAFGQPSQEVNGEAHFSYDGLFLVVQYDTVTGETTGVYLLAEDYGYEEDTGAE